jgi:hypothetical protein
MMLMLLNLKNLYSFIHPTTNYDLGQVACMVERLLTKSYGIPAESMRYIPVSFRMEYEMIIHQELQKVLPILKRQAFLGKTIFVDVTIKGTLILSTEDLKCDYAIFQSC